MELPEQPIAEGRVAEIYTWGDGKVVKLSRDWVPEDWLAYEFRIAQIVFESGLRVPQPYELVRANGKTGIVFERVDGPTMLDQIGSAPQRARAFGTTLGRLHADMHARAGGEGLPEVHTRLKNKIDSVEGAPEEVKRAAQESLQALAENGASGNDDMLLHGDFHPDNVIMAEQGPVIIDWPDASRGHPLADVARTVIISNLGGVPPNPVLGALVGLLRKWFTRAYLSTYFQRAPYLRSELDRWIFPVLFARLSEDIESERPRSVAWLQKLYDDRN